MRGAGAGVRGTRAWPPRPGVLLALAAARGAPLLTALVLLGRARTADLTTVRPASGTDGTEQRLVDVVLSLAVARLVVPVLLAPLALVASLVVPLVVVLVLAGGVTVATRAAGLG